MATRSAKNNPCQEAAARQPVVGERNLTVAYELTDWRSVILPRPFRETFHTSKQHDSFLFLISEDLFLMYDCPPQHSTRHVPLSIISQILHFILLFHSSQQSIILLRLLVLPSHPLLSSTPSHSTWSPSCGSEIPAVQGRHPPRLGRRRRRCLRKGKRRREPD